MKAKKNHDRSDDQTALTFSLPKSLKEKIEEAAAKERRSKSNWITIALEQILSEQEASANQHPKSESSSLSKKKTKPTA